MSVQAAARSLQDPRWSSFVAGHPAALPFHHPSWAAAIAACYGFRAFALTVDRPDGAIVAGLPVIEVRRRREPPRWVSLPFTDTCPPLVTGAPGAALAQQLDAARRAAGISRLEVRGELSGPAVHPNGTYLTHELPLTGSEREIFARLHANQVRRNIRRAERAGVTVRIGTAEQDLTGVFYRLHTRTRRRLGVAVQPLRYFRALWRHVLQPGHGAVLIAEHDGAPVAAAVFLTSAGTCVYKYGASDERHWEVRPNHMLFWQAIRWARERGCRTLDFGRTDVEDRGLWEFKARWGTDVRELTYHLIAEDPPAAGRGGMHPGVRSIIRHGPQVVPRVLGELLYRRYA
ncbi:lipid II:glycine glycyltransferase FemX [Spirilliplanes yamanashiensis]|uniref:Methicillin resistance protein n=1 Tax=Spirilliplanes yamanashiensis TaxID=42233 RepID=A0A8J3YC22_9ACTN|nr:GNAT family N-acetyltransferase [Spirilliplanes yamanashiensis]MDP9818194.1 CelD/BcsL family acetyltransferase involved in cellulose biosynthesis [Spirilliplanes yamanashiensis]GIJ05005.1 methicillin resistance protein [Spirilliplanes yamanashiensis]